jgi:hypothetical protein
MFSGTSVAEAEQLFGVKPSLKKPAQERLFALARALQGAVF